MKSIKTKYLPATNRRGLRIKATAGGMSVTVPYDHSKSDVYVHFEAVKGLVEKHGLAWDVSRMVYGGTERGYVFCFPQSTVEA